MPGSQHQRVKVLGLKMSMPAGADCTPEMLAKINGYAMTEMKAEDVYVRRFLMAHSCIDRDNECFPPEMLDQFAATMPGKSMLEGHDRRSRPCGKFFDASTEDLAPDQFKAMTGEDPRMPDGMDRCKVLWAWSYMLKTPGNEELIAALDGGVCSFCSIGFAASDLVAVRDNANGPAKYWQYVSPGEALEGSLVWLGAQPGAAAYKQASQPRHHERQEEESMKEFLSKLGKALGLSKALEEDQDAAIEAVKTALAAKDAKIAELEPMANDGKAYRAVLVADAVKFATIAGEIGDDEKAKKEEEDFLKTLAIDRLKRQRDKYESAARAKCPTHAAFKSKDEGDRNRHQEDGKEKSRETSGRKDFTDPAHNDLFKMVGK